MPNKLTLHFALMCNRSNGGFFSALTLIDGLQDYFDIHAWSLYGEYYPGHESLFEQRGIQLSQADPVVALDPGEAVFFYMNEYPTLFRNFSAAWQPVLQSAGAVQIAFNRTVGALPMESWLASIVDHIYFQDGRMQKEWNTMVSQSSWTNVTSSVMPPPVELTQFLSLPSQRTGPLVFGRLAGDGAVPDNAVDFYRHLAAQHPQAEFWFMPAPESLVSALTDHPQFRFYAANEISVTQFLQHCDVYMLTYQQGVPIPGPRSLVEAMAAGCAPLVVNRDGPKERVIHGESGFCANTDEEFFDFANQLATNSLLRSTIAANARRRARTFKVEHWVERIHSQINNHNKR